MRGMGQIVSWSVRDESLHCDGIVRLFHAFAAETGALVKPVRDDIVECARTVVSLEDRFIDLAFELGPIEGLDAAQVKRYIRYVADWRLQQLGRYLLHEQGDAAVGLDQVPEAVDDQRGVRQVRVEEPAQRVPQRLHGLALVRLVQKDRRVSTCEQEPVALGQRQIQVLRQVQQQLPARLGPARLDEAEVSRRHLGVQRKLELAEPTAQSPEPDQLAGGLGLLHSVEVTREVMDAKPFLRDRCTNEHQ